MANVSSSNGLEKRPKLRFPGFDEPWKVFKAEELFQNITDKNHPDETVLTIIQGKGTLPREQAGRNIHYDDASLSNYKKVEQGDFIIHLRSFEGGLEMANEAGIVSPAYTILRCKRPHSSLFYDAYFHTDEFINHNLSKSVEGIRDGRQISYEAFKWLGIPYCEPTEQEKISNLFAALNERIAKQRDLVESLKKYKRGLLSNAFRNASSWRKKRLGEICCIRTGKLDANAMVNDGKYPFFTCARERYSIDTYAFDTDALLISGNGANVGYIHHYTGKFNAYQRTYVLDQFQEDINYVHVYLNRFLSSRIDAEKKAGNTPYIVLSTLSDMEIYIPDETTTKQLVDLFTQIENRISYSATVLEYLSSQRRGLLQQLFI